ncbi:MAG TPA: FAD-dependent oxidoreductase [Cyclobacteriaceae bacterium]|nr:FAD-dependent oxidoreductase [Cyclobacteriaceae bacterium]
MSTNTFSPASSYNSILSQRGSLRKGDTAIVVGAGAFGGWTALYLLRRGIKVTLMDAWGSGNSRSSSGDETRVIRSTYGANEFYFDLNVRALELWKEHQRSWNRQVFFNTGVLWLCHSEKCALVDDSIPFSKKHRMEYEFISKNDLAKKFPLVNSGDLHHGWYDPYGGYLKARESTQLVMDTFVKEGGTFVNAFVSQETELRADTIIYACGSWLGRMFPKEIGDRISCSKQEVYYFGVPQANASEYDQFPVWVDADDKDYYYGIPGNANRGFKVGVDRRGKPFDPTNGERILEPEVLAHARGFLANRFPGLRDAPLVESRVCPYENSPDGNFIFERHPTLKNVWFLGGGSGHGFKHGPALGEMVASCLVGG